MAERHAPDSAASDRLAHAIRPWLRVGPAPTIDERPQSAFDVQIKQRVEEHARELTEIRSRVNALFFLAIGAVLIDILIRLAK